MAHHAFLLLMISKHPSQQHWLPSSCVQVSTEDTATLYKLQIKNKWDKLKSEYTTWNKLLAMRAGLPWDSARGTIAADDEWWKKKNKELPGTRKFRNGGLQNMDKLKVMFDYITSNGVDHSPLAANGFPSAPESPMDGGVDHSPLATQGLPSAPDSPVNSVDHSPLAADGLPSDSDPDSPMNGVDHLPLAADGLPSAPVSPMYGVNLDGSGNNTEHNGGTHPEQESFPPSTRNKKRPGHVNSSRKNKKSKTETALVMQAHLDRILELAQKAQATFEKFCSRPDPPSASSIQDAMTLVRECGARCRSNEHFIATELFVNREQREMFLTMETAEERFQWLRRKYIVKYLSSPSMGLR